MGIDLHMAAKFFNVGADHVHAHAASRDVRYSACGGQPRGKNEIEAFAFGELLGLGGGDDPFGNRVFDHPVRVDASPVVSHAKDHLSCLVIGVEHDGGFGRLASLHPLRRGLDAVVGSVSKDMGERVDEALDNGLVELDVAP